MELVEVEVPVEKLKVEMMAHLEQEKVEAKLGE